jgi:hypothetical protein
MTETQRWIKSQNTRGTNPAIDAFLDEIVAVCKKHGMSISHEDQQGGFDIEPFDEHYVRWLSAASDGITPKEVPAGRLKARIKS